MLEVFYTACGAAVLCIIALAGKMQFVGGKQFPSVFSVQASRLMPQSRAGQVPAFLHHKA